MHDIAATTLKKKLLIGAGVLALILATIGIGLYTTYRAGADQFTSNVAAPEEADMRIDLKINDGLVELEKITNVAEPETASNSTEQGQTSSTNSNVEVQVNGTPIDLPENGSVQKEIVTEDGSAKINISSQSNTSSGDTRTRSSIRIDSDTDSSLRIRSHSTE